MLLTLAATGAALAALASPAAAAGPANARGAQVAPGFTGQAMWIWVLDRTERGDPARIAARARAAGVTAVYVKAGDGASLWRQFTPQVVAALKAGGLRVCAWQFVYGRRPLAEARVGAAAVARGADCLITDAETAYEGRRASAVVYLRELRARIGRSFPLALTSFPYVDVHPGFPYSVFLGPGGAQVNMPQVYWKDIGDRVDRSLERTMRLNRVYARPIHPIGQLYQAPATADVVRFGRLATAYAAPGVSWWEWTFAPARLWNALPRTLPASAPTAAPDPGWPLLARGARGDLVRRAQDLLRAKRLPAPRSARMDAATIAALKGFQASRGLTPTGTTDAATWPALLGLPAPAAAPVPAPATAPNLTGGAAAR
ncbi:MAG: peptidoglycan-binding protein [Solirubrobacteraceae bacterium]|nr:peptidoglycan-binding protein [Solirubrobacteraceae bacterium]